MNYSLKKDYIELNICLKYLNISRKIYLPNWEFGLINLKNPDLKKEMVIEKKRK